MQLNVRRVALVLVLIFGIVLVIFPFATNLFSKTSGAEHLTDTFRPTFSTAALQQTSQDFDTINAMANQLTTETLPALPGALHMSDQQFSAYLAQNDPDVVAGVTALPTILPRFQTLVTGLGAEQSNFQKADSIPTSWLPITVVPWLVLVPGIILIVVAVVGLRGGTVAKRGTAALVVAAIVGVVFTTLATSCSLHSKGQAVDHLTAALQPFFTVEGAAKTRTDLDTVQAMADQLQKTTVPALAQALGMSNDEFAAFLTKSFPAVAKGYGQLDTILPRFQADVTAISANTGSFSKTATIPWSWMPTADIYWWVLLPGLVLILVPVIVFLSEIGDPGIAARRTTRVGHA